MRKKNKIGLIVKSIRFTEFSIVYKVELQKPASFSSTPFYPNENIIDKDLVFDGSLLCSTSMQVSFKSSNMTPLYLQALLTKKLPSYEEHNSDIDNYYNINDLIGFVFI